MEKGFPVACGGCLPGRSSRTLDMMRLPMKAVTPGSQPQAARNKVTAIEAKALLWSIRVKQEFP